MSDLQADCRSIRESLLAYLATQLEVSAEDNSCSVTLPIKTLDDRYLEIFIDRTVTEHVFVNDGGNAVAELFLQGIHMTDARKSQLRGIARRYGAFFENDTFTMAVKPAGINDAVLAIAQCTSLAMHDVLKHEPVIEDEPVAALVRRTLKRYETQNVEMRYRVPIRGNADAASAEHVFDAVAFPRVPGRRAVAVKTLGTAYNPNIQAERYGFLALDIKGSEYDKWPRLAVVAKADKWPKDALSTVRRLSARTLELTSKDEEALGKLLIPTLDELAKVA